MVRILEETDEERMFFAEHDRLTPEEKAEDYFNKLKNRTPVDGQYKKELLEIRQEELERHYRTELYYIVEFGRKGEEWARRLIRESYEMLFKDE